MVMFLKNINRLRNFETRNIVYNKFSCTKKRFNKLTKQYRISYKTIKIFISILFKIYSGFCCRASRKSAFAYSDFGEDKEEKTPNGPLGQRSVSLVS